MLGGIQINGIEHLPYRGPVILAPNHVSLVDPWIMCAAVPNPMRSMAAEYLYRTPGLAQYLYGMGAFPLKQGSTDHTAMSRARAYLKRGATLMIFPEGGCSPDGLPKPWLPGVAVLSLRSGAPVIPVVIQGSRDCLPLGTFRPRYSPMTVTFLPPVPAPPISSVGIRNQVKEHLECLEQAWHKGAARLVQQGSQVGLQNGLK
ncbi:1-acyl-sn-glycerol-3-phosphate acyltransferase [bacterium]|nr:1-acyl-sn-glycerol-3-phosphate acyltransferase [bacterium]